MLTLFRLLLGLSMLVLLWACFKVLFVSDAQGGPGFFIQSWHESPIATLIAIAFLLVCAVLIFRE
jgi:hypothetical protein